MLRKLCETYTDLDTSDIERLEEIAGTIQLMADITNADVFIDCMTRAGDTAVAVAEANPTNYPSNYERSALGALVKRMKEPAVLRTLELGMPTMDMVATTPEDSPVYQRVVPIKNDRDRTIGCLIMEKDVSMTVSQKKHVELLTETTEKLTETILSLKGEKDDKTLVGTLGEGVVIFDKKGMVVYANPSADMIYRKLGYKDDILGMSFSNIVLDGSDFESVVKSQVLNIPDLTIGNLALKITYSVLHRENELAGLNMLIKDMTDVKNKEKELVLKSIANKEIHHRVKNNLQTIASLLRLQSRRIDDKSVKEMFESSIARVLSISVTHELLAQSGVDEVDLMYIITKLRDSIISYNLSARKRIEIIVSGDNLRVDSDLASSIALVANEFIQNSLKHAFEDRDSGKIEIIIQKGIMYSYVLITDDGIGFDLSQEIGSESLGFKIVRNIVKDKLQGEINMESSEKGTRIKFDFKNPDSIV